MLKTRAALIFIAIVFTILLYALPRTIVKNNNSEGIEAASNEAEKSADATDKESVSNFLENFRNNANNEKSAIFADSLGSLYAERGIYDSAAWYFGWIADHTDNLPAALKAGNFYYEAFQTAPSKEDAGKYGEKARQYLERYLLNDPENADAKAKVAMTYVATDNAMKGIGMLREVVDKHPDNEEALYNLGILTIQIAQYQKAAERLEKLIKINPDHINGRFYLGICYAEMKKIEAAREQFLKAKELTTDPGILAAIENYLEQLKNK